MGRAGGFGRFQWIACFFIVLGADCSALITQCLYLLELQPAYLCKSGEVWVSCMPEQFCTLQGKPNGVEYKIDWTNPESLDNWFVHLSMECKQFVTKGQYPLSLFQISFLTGLILGMIIFPKLSDLSGRKSVFYMGVFMHVMLVLTSFMTTEASWFYGLLFFMGIE